MCCGMVASVDLSRDKDETALLVRACAPGEITVNEQRISSPFLLSAKRLIPDWPVSDPARLVPSDFELAIELQPDLVILGTGERLVFPDAEVSATLLARGIGFEVMDTRAACRTYNLLVIDGRPVVAALLQLSRNSPGNMA